jgi:hypothetical protein
MTDNEKILLIALAQTSNPNMMAIMLQSFIAEMGPLSEEAGAKVREMLRHENTPL